MKTKKTLLVVDDEANIRRILEISFEKVGYEVVSAGSSLEALKVLREREVDLALSDVTMPGMNGYQLLQEIRKFHPKIPVVMMTAFGTIPDAIQAIRDGATEYITKPFDLDSLKKIVAGVIREKVKSDPTRNSVRIDSGPIAASEAMIQVFDLATQVAPSRATVMIGGESGVGKEVVAKILHEKSGRTGPFVAVSCAALPETLLESELFGYEKGAFTGAQSEKQGRFESAHGGTLFLDEVGEIPPSVQVKLLRALQEREIERLGSNKSTPVNVRIITATHKNLQEAVDAGKFRLDLLYRLQVVEIVIPPLRERIEDIEPMALAFLSRFCAENNRPLLTIDREILRAMQSYSWPGNVRELENVIERSVVLASKSQIALSISDLPRSFRNVA